MQGVKCYIVDSFLGFFAYDDSLKLISWKRFDPETAAGRLLELEKSGTCPELEDLVRSLSGMDYSTFVFEDESEAKSMSSRFGLDMQVAFPSAGGRAFRASVANAAISAGIGGEEAEGMLREVSIALVRSKVREASEKRDRLVAHAVVGLDELDKNVNISVSRVREWYGLHFPELNDLVPDHKQYNLIVSRYGNRSNMDLGGLNEIVQNENKAQNIYEIARRSMGADITTEDLKPIRDLAEVNLKTYQLRDELERYVDETMKEIAPNVRELAGANLGARLIAMAGSLEGLAKKPASTIQVLGAEKALFRSLKTGARPPKHGIIFQHQYLHQAPRWQRGKIARALAGKISIAARVDAFGGEYIAESLKKDLEKRFGDIQKKYSTPPKRPERREFGRERFRGRGEWRGGRGKFRRGGGRDRWRGGGRDRGWEGSRDRGRDQSRDRQGGDRQWRR